MSLFLGGIDQLWIHAQQVTDVAPCHQDALDFAAAEAHSQPSHPLDDIEREQNRAHSGVRLVQRNLSGVLIPLARLQDLPASPGMQHADPNRHPEAVRVALQPAG